MMFSDSLVFFWRAGLFGLFVSTCLFCPWAVEAETMDDGYLARVVARLVTLASWPLISRQGFRVRPFVFMTNLPTMEKTESRMMRFVLAQQAKRARLFFYSTQVCAG